MGWQEGGCAWTNLTAFWYVRPLTVTYAQCLGALAYTGWSDEGKTRGVTVVRGCPCLRSQVSYSHVRSAKFRDSSAQLMSWLRAEPRQHYLTVRYCLKEHSLHGTKITQFSR